MVTTEEGDWAFLRPWFQVLKNRVGFRDRFGRMRVKPDWSSDLWMEVQFQPTEAAVGDGAVAENAAVTSFGQLREALVLTSLLVNVDYSLWLKRMCDIGLKLSMSRVGNEPPLSVQYLFTCPSPLDTLPRGMSGSFHDLLTVSDYSDEYTRDLLRMRVALARNGIEWKTLAPIPVLLDYTIQAADLPSPERRIDVITDSIAVNQLLTHSGSVFKVTALALDTAQTTLNPLVMDALCALISSGIRVEYLSLPHRLTAGPLCYARGGHFMRTLLSIASDSPEGEKAGVVRLSIPCEYAKTQLWAPFCSALAVSRKPSVLQLENLDEDTFALGPNTNSRRRAWSWLAFALFSSASSTSVKTLAIIGQVIRQTAVEGVQAIATSADPAASLCPPPPETSAISTPTSCHHRPRIKISESEIVSTGDGRYVRNYIPFFDDEYRWEGEIVHTDPTSGEDLVLVAGLGFCRINTRGDPERRHKRQKLEGPCGCSPLESSFHSLVYQTKALGISHYLTKLLEIIGHRVRALNTFVRPTRSKMLEKVFSSCPNLAKLSIKRGSFETMDVFTRAYEVHNLPLSSLELYNIDVPDDALQDFLRSLSQEGKAEATLQCLCFGKSWRRELSTDTLAVLKSVLDHNESLTTLRYYLSVDQTDVIPLDEYHGQRVTGLPIVALRDHLIRLGYLGHLTDRYPHLHLDDRVKHLIWQYTSPEPIRRKVSRGRTIIRERRVREAVISGGAGVQEVVTQVAQDMTAAVVDGSTVS